MEGVLADGWGLVRGVVVAGGWGLVVGCGV